MFEDRKAEKIFLFYPQDNWMMVFTTHYNDPPWNRSVSLWNHFGSSKDLSFGVKLLLVWCTKLDYKLDKNKYESVGNCKKQKKAVNGFET